jgi:hypothetical protein
MGTPAELGHGDSGGDSGVKRLRPTLILRIRRDEQPGGNGGSDSRGDPV